MREPYDTSFEALLVSTLAERAERVPPTVTLERVHARLEERQSARRRGSVRRPLTLLGVAAAILLPVAALVVGQRPSEPTPADAGAYQALVRRRDGDRWLVVAVRGNGQERVLTSVPILDPGSDRRRPQMAVSDDGWLATPGSTGWEFRDLRSPERLIGPIASFLAAEAGRGWIGDGRLATWNKAGEIQFLDPEAGTVTRASMPEALTCEFEGDGCEVIAWTADGSAVVARSGFGPAPVFSSGERRPAGWRVLPLDGGVAEPPSSDLDLGWRSGTWWRDDGSRVQLCDMAVRGECPGLPNGAVVVESADGTIAPWYTDELAPGDVVDTALGDTGVWLLVDQRDGRRQEVLAYLEAPGTVSTVATWGTTRGQGYIEDVAPDESLVVAGSLLIDARTGHLEPLRGSFLGFVPSSAVDGWSSAPYRTPDPVASPPPPLPVPTILSFDTIVADQLTPADRELWRGDHVAVDGPGASPTTLEIGPIVFDEGVGVFLACDGPSDVLVTAETDDGSTLPGFPLLSRCLAADEHAGGQVPAASIRASVRFEVTTTPDTSWRLLIFDPAPAPAP